MAGGGLNALRRRAAALEGTESRTAVCRGTIICEDTEGNIWAATQNGVLVRRIREKWTPLSTAAGWPQEVTSVAADPKGGVWIGTRLQGLQLWRDGKSIAWGEASNCGDKHSHLAGEQGWGMCGSGEETPQAIQRLRKRPTAHVRIPQDSRVIRAMAEDSLGNIWAGTSKGLLFRITGVKSRRCRLGRKRNWLPFAVCTPLRTAALWIGYRGLGLGGLRQAVCRDPDRTRPL